MMGRSGNKSRKNDSNKPNPGILGTGRRSPQQLGTVGGGASATRDPKADTRVRSTQPNTVLGEVFVAGDPSDNTHGNGGALTGQGVLGFEEPLNPAPKPSVSNKSMATGGASSKNASEVKAENPPTVEISDFTRYIVDLIKANCTNFDISKEDLTVPKFTGDMPETDDFSDAVMDKIMKELKEAMLPIQLDNAEILKSVLEGISQLLRSENPKTWFAKKDQILDSESSPALHSLEVKDFNIYLELLHQLTPLTQEYQALKEHKIVTWEDIEEIENQGKLKENVKSFSPTPNTCFMAASYAMHLDEVKKDISEYIVDFVEAAHLSFNGTQLVQDTIEKPTSADVAAASSGETPPPTEAETTFLTATESGAGAPIPKAAFDEKQAWDNLLKGTKTTVGALSDKSHKLDTVLGNSILATIYNEHNKRLKDYSNKHQTLYWLSIGYAMVSAGLTMGYGYLGLTAQLLNPVTMAMGIVAVIFSEYLMVREPKHYPKSKSNYTQALMIMNAVLFAFVGIGYGLLNLSVPLIMACVTWMPVLTQAYHAHRFHHDSHDALKAKNELVKGTFNETDSLFLDRGLQLNENKEGLLSVSTKA